MTRRRMELDLATTRKMLARGASVREIAAVHECSYDVGLRRLKEAGLYETNRAPRGPAPDMAKARAVLALRDLGGETFRQIGDRLDVSRQRASQLYIAAKGLLADEDHHDQDTLERDLRRAHKTYPQQEEKSE